MNIALMDEIELEHSRHAQRIGEPHAWIFRRSSLEVSTLEALRISENRSSLNTFQLLSDHLVLNNMVLGCAKALNRSSFDTTCDSM